MEGLFNSRFSLRNGYRHFNSLIEEFEAEKSNYRAVSINNHYFNIDSLGPEARVSRFIRDPRDLVVSGYFYHKRGAEQWSRIINPHKSDWRVVNGNLPDNFPVTASLSSYLNTVDKEDGLIAEIDFRKHHFESMISWPLSDPRIQIFFYEDILGNEVEAFRKLFEFYNFSEKLKRRGSKLAERYSASKQEGKSDHIRNQLTGQWREHFTPRVNAYFNERYATLLEKYRYDVSN